VTVFGVSEPFDEDFATRIASESARAPNLSGLQSIAVGSLVDEFERDCVDKLQRLQVMPRSVLVHDVGYYPALPTGNASKSNSYDNKRIASLWSALSSAISIAARIKSIIQFFLKPLPQHNWCVLRARAQRLPLTMATFLRIL
jgi:hypothetical protein